MSFSAVVAHGPLWYVCSISAPPPHPYQLDHTLQISTHCVIQVHSSNIDPVQCTKTKLGSMMSLTEAFDY